MKYIILSIFLFSFSLVCRADSEVLEILESALDERHSAVEASFGAAYQMTDDYAACLSSPYAYHILDLTDPNNGDESLSLFVFVEEIVPYISDVQKILDEIPPAPPELEALPNSKAFYGTPEILRPDTSGLSSEEEASVLEDWEEAKAERLIAIEAERISLENWADGVYEIIRNIAEQDLAAFNENFDKWDGYTVQRKKSVDPVKKEKLLSRWFNQNRKSLIEDGEGVAMPVDFPKSTYQVGEYTQEEVDEMRRSFNDWYDKTLAELTETLDSAIKPEVIYDPDGTQREAFEEATRVVTEANSSSQANWQTAYDAWHDDRLSRLETALENENEEYLAWLEETENSLEYRKRNQKAGLLEIVGRSSIGPEIDRFPDLHVVEENYSPTTIPWETGDDFESCSDRLVKIYEEIRRLSAHYTSEVKDGEYHGQQSLGAWESAAPSFQVRLVKAIQMIDDMKSIRWPVHASSFNQINYNGAGTFEYAKFEAFDIYDIRHPKLGVPSIVYSFDFSSSVINNDETDESVSKHGTANFPVVSSKGFEGTFFVKTKLESNGWKTANVKVGDSAWLRPVKDELVLPSIAMGDVYIEANYTTAGDGLKSSTLKGYGCEGLEEIVESTMLSGQPLSWLNLSGDAPEAFRGYSECFCTPNFTVGLPELPASDNAPFYPEILRTDADSCRIAIPLSENTYSPDSPPLLEFRLSNMRNSILWEIAEFSGDCAALRFTTNPLGTSIGNTKNIETQETYSLESVPDSLLMLPPSRVESEMVVVELEWELYQVAITYRDSRNDKKIGEYRLYVDGAPENTIVTGLKKDNHNTFCIEKDGVKIGEFVITSEEGEGVYENEVWNYHDLMDDSKFHYRVGWDETGNEKLKSAMLVRDGEETEIAYNSGNLPPSVGNRKVVEDENGVAKFQGAGWDRDGDVLVTDGNSNRHDFQFNGMSASLAKVATDNQLVTTFEIDGEKFSETTVTYTNCGRTITIENPKGESVIEMMSLLDTGGRINLPSSITTPQGRIDYDYTDDFRTVTVSRDIDGKIHKSIHKVTERGAFASVEHLVGSNVIGSTTASGHADGYLGLPTSFVSKNGNVQSKTDLSFKEDGMIGGVTPENGIAKVFAYDAWGRLDAGTSIDGKAITPSYSPFKSGITVGGENVESKLNEFGEVEEYSNSFGDGLSVKHPDNHTVSVETNDGDQSALIDLRKDGSVETNGGGIGSPGSKNHYAMGRLNGEVCLIATVTVLDGSDYESKTVSKTYINNIGQVLRRTTPHPSGKGTVNTDYRYDNGELERVILPKPSKPIIFETANGSTTVKQGTMSYTLKESIEGNKVKRELLRGSTSLSEVVSTFGSGSTTYHRYGRKTGETTVSDDGTEVIVSDTSSGDEVTLKTGKYGLDSIIGTKQGESFNLGVPTRDQFGAPTSLDIDPAGAVGPHNISFNKGRLTGVSGPSVDISVENAFVNGGREITVQDNKRGETSRLLSDSRGHLREQEVPGKPAIRFEGDVLKGEVVVEAGGLPGQKVTIKTGPTGALIEKKRNDNSGNLYGYNDDGSLDSLTRYDGSNGGRYTFKFLQDANTGLPGGFQGKDYSVQNRYTDDGILFKTIVTAKTVDGDSLSHGLNFLDFFEDSPRTTEYDGILGGIKVTEVFDPVSGLLIGLRVWKDGNQIHGIDYGWINGRLKTVSTSQISAEYDYSVANQVKVTSQLGEMTKLLLPDGSGRLSAVEIRAGPVGNLYEARYDFTNGARTKQTLIRPGHGNVVWNYQFASGQLQNAGSNQGDSYSYNHDAMFNRGGTQVNPSNQYRFLKTPQGSVYQVVGRVRSDATVMITRAGAEPLAVPVNEDGSFRVSFTHPLGVKTQQIPVKVVARIPGGGTEGADAVAHHDREIILPPAKDALSYGAHGALAADHRWMYQWNTLGRLAGMETRMEAVVAGYPNQRLRFIYDHLGQRIWKKSETLSDDGATVSKTIVTKFVYHRDLLLAEFISDSETGESHRLYTRGIDLSGSLNGAGGVGGLLSITNSANQTIAPVYDGNGNVIGATDQNGVELVYRKMGPFGEKIEANGDEGVCPVGFATHYVDKETELVYFGQRYYSPVQGRWLSREPLGEFESFNLYTYCHNDPINKYDYLGLAEKGSGPNFLERFFARLLPASHGALTGDPGSRLQSDIRYSTLGPIIAPVGKAEREVGKVVSALATPEVVGTMQILGGGSEALIGGAGVLAPEPTTSVGGLILVYHGMDTYRTGFETWRTGEIQRTGTSSMIQTGFEYAGMNSGLAESIAQGVDGGLGGGGSWALGRRLATMTKLSETRIATSYHGPRTAQLRPQGTLALDVADNGKNYRVAQLLDNFEPIGAYEDLGFYGVRNSAGGEVWVATREVNFAEIQRLAQLELPGQVNVVGGGHGTTLGHLGAFDDPLARAMGDMLKHSDSITFIDIANTPYSSLVTTLNGPGRTVCGWCWSERSVSVIRNIK